MPTLPVNPSRITPLRLTDKPENGPVVYWMSREQRISDNWSLIFAQEKTEELKQPMILAFCLVPEFLSSSTAQYQFMLTGLKQVHNRALDLNIPFLLLFGSPEVEIVKLCRKIKASTLITDFDPLNIKQSWQKEIA